MSLLARIRVLLPSWRFFDRAVRSPALLVCCDDGDWRPLLPPPRTALRWAFAPWANLALAEQSVVEQLVALVEALEVTDDDIADDAPAIVESVPYQLVAAIAHERARRAGAVRYRWKLVTPDGDTLIDFLTAPERAA